MSQAPQKKQSGFAGTLNNLHPIDIVQLCCLSVSTMAIRVTKEALEGAIYIQNGEVVHAIQSENSGVEAFFTIMGWDSGIFETFEAPPISHRTIHENYQSLLMEASRRNDENNRQQRKEPSSVNEKKLRVLIVDDSPIMSKILTSVYTAQGDIEVAGIARNGEEAIEMIDTTKPDLITLDINMPVMDGSTAIKHIMIKKPCPVVVMSALGDSSQNRVLQFLDLGAVDFMSKPVRQKNILLQQEKIIARLRRCADSNIEVFRRTPPLKPIPPDKKALAGLAANNEIIVINCGATAPAAILHLLDKLSHETSAPIVMMQTLPPVLIPPLADFLDSRSRYHVIPINDRVKLASNTVFLCTPGYDMELISTSNGFFIEPDETFDFDQRLQSCFDRFLISAARIFSGGCYVVLLSGAQLDSLEGLEEIEQNNGSIILQKRSTCIMSGSLDFVQGSHLTSHELSLDQIGSFLKAQQFLPLNQL